MQCQMTYLNFLIQNTAVVLWAVGCTEVSAHHFLPAGIEKKTKTKTKLLFKNCSWKCILENNGTNIYGIFKQCNKYLFIWCVQTMQQIYIYMVYSNNGTHIYICVCVCVWCVQTATDIRCPSDDLSFPSPPRHLYLSSSSFYFLKFISSLARTSC